MSQIPACSHFQEVIEVVETLPPDDQVLLVDIIRRRLIQHRRSDMMEELVKGGVGRNDKSKDS